MIAARTFVLPAGSAARRKRARRFWGTMGVMLRQTSLGMDDRNASAAPVMQKANDTYGIRFEARSWRGN